jgi:hypothetical protein
MTDEERSEEDPCPGTEPCGEGEEGQHDDTTRIDQPDRIVEGENFGSAHLECAGRYCRVECSGGEQPGEVVHMHRRNPLGSVAEH